MTKRLYSERYELKLVDCIVIYYTVFTYTTIHKIHSMKIMIDEALLNFIIVNVSNNNSVLFTSYGESNGFSNALPQSIDKRGQATCTHLYQ